MLYGDNDSSSKSSKLELIAKPFSKLEAVLRDTVLEAELKLELVAPTQAQRLALVAQFETLMSLAGLCCPELEFPTSVLVNPLTATQRERIDQVLEPRYAAAISKDETPRENFEYRECGERMVDLRKAASEVEVLWSSTPFNPACGPEFGGKPRIFWARESVAERLVAAARAFNAIGIVIQIEDGFRPVAVQEGLFRRRYKMIQESYPALSAEELFVATSGKTAAAPYRAAHMGGAAIDFTLWRADGRGEHVALELGNQYPTGGAATYLDFPYVTWDQFVTRTLFRVVSEAVGLSVYRGEDWHVSAGDAQAALLDGESTVRFCAIKRFDVATGEIEPFPVSEMRRFFLPE